MPRLRDPRRLVIASPAASRLTACGHYPFFNSANRFFAASACSVSGWSWITRSSSLTAWSAWLFSANAAGRLHQGQGAQVRIVVGERHHQQRRRRLGVALLGQAAQADVQLRLRAQVGRRGRRHLSIEVHGVVVPPLALQRPADAVAGVRRPRAVGETVVHLLIRLPARLPLLAWARA